MARTFSKNSSNYMTLGVDALAPLLNGAAQISMAALVNATTFTTAVNDNGLLFVCINGVVGALSLAVSDNPARVKVTARSVTSDSLQSVIGVTTVTTGVWHHVGGVVNIAGDSIRIYLNGVQDFIAGSLLFGNTTWTRGTPTGIDFIAARSATIPPPTSVQWDGGIAELAVWRDDIGTSGFAALAKGVVPALIMPTSLVAYWPLMGYASPEIDWFGARSGTITGSVPALDHPVVFPIQNPQRRRQPAGAAAPTTVFRRTLSKLGTRTGARQVHGT